jgi:hypothetical protein
MPSPGSTNGTTTPTVPTDGKKKINWLTYAIVGGGIYLLGYIVYKAIKKRKK